MDLDTHNTADRDQLRQRLLDAEFAEPAPAPACTVLDVWRDYGAPANVLSHVNTLLVGARRQRRSNGLTLPRDRALLTVLFSTGCRIHEALKLDRADVDDGTRAELLVVGKGGKARVLFFSDDVLIAIREYLVARTDRDPALFLRHDTAHQAAGKRPGYLGAWKQLQVYASECGVRLTPHHFRHALATGLLNNGACLAEVQDILGHSSPETTKRVYAHYQTNHLRDVTDRFRRVAEEIIRDA